MAKLASEESSQPVDSKANQPVSHAIAEPMVVQESPRLAWRYSREQLLALAPPAIIDRLQVMCYARYVIYFIYSDYYEQQFIRLLLTVLFIF